MTFTRKRKAKGTKKRTTIFYIKQIISLLAKEKE
jgi:hypothetical protein